jgi:hypothetical protein
MDVLYYINFQSNGEFCEIRIRYNVIISQNLKFLKNKIPIFNQNYDKCEILSIKVLSPLKIKHDNHFCHPILFLARSTNLPKYFCLLLKSWIPTRFYFYNICYLSSG